MEIRNLETFVSLAKTKSFTKTAEQLSYAQSTVTIQIQQLENELGYPLFDRIGKSVSLTSNGNDFLNHAIQILALVDRASALNKDLKQTKGVLRIGALESLLLSHVLKVVPSFKEEYPLLDIKLEMGHSTELIHRLKENSLDLVYVFGEEANDNDFNSFFIKKQGVIFVCGADNHLANKKNISLSELFLEDFVLTENTGFCNSTLNKMASQNGFTLKNKIEVDSIFAVAQLVKENVGIAFLPECAVERYLKNGTLKKIDVDFKNDVYDSWILCHKNRWVSPFMSKFIEELKIKTEL